MVKDEVTNALEQKPFEEMTSLGVEEEVDLAVEEQVPGLGNLLVLGVLANLQKVQVGRFAPVSHFDVVEVGGHENAGMKHGVLLVLGHHRFAEILEPILQTVLDR